MKALLAKWVIGALLGVAALFGYHGGNVGSIYNPTQGGGGGGTGSGNVLVSPTSSVIANIVPYYVTVGSSTLSATSGINSFNSGDVTIGSSTDGGLLSVVNASNTVAFSVASTVGNANRFQVLSATGTNPYLGVTSSGIPLFLGTSTAVAIGGSSLAIDACTSTTTIVPFPLSTSTDILNTQPQININPANFPYSSFISATAAGSSTITTQVCDTLAAGATPTSTKYNFTIQRISGM